MFICVSHPHLVIVLKKALQGDIRIVCLDCSVWVFSADNPIAIPYKLLLIYLTTLMLSQIKKTSQVPWIYIIVLSYIFHIRSVNLFFIFFIFSIFVCLHCFLYVVFGMTLIWFGWPSVSWGSKISQSVNQLFSHPVYCCCALEATLFPRHLLMW